MSEKFSNADAVEPLAIGVDIGGTGIKAAIVDVRGELLESFCEPSPRSTSALRDFVDLVVKRAKAPVRGIGVGCKGIIDANSTRVKSSPGDLCFLEGQLLSEVIGAGDVPVCAENDARAAFGKLSDKAVKAAAGQNGYYVAHCPMKNKDWVQTSTTISNPYGGKDMVGCGEIKK